MKLSLTCSVFLVFKFLHQTTRCAMYTICDPERSGRFILFVSPSIWPSPSLISVSPRWGSPCLDIVLHCLSLLTFHPLSLWRPNFPSSYLWPSSHLPLLFFSTPSHFRLTCSCVRETVRSLLFTSSWRYAGRRVFAPSPHLPFSSRTWDHFIIFMSVKSRMDGRILQIARTDVVHSRK